jgi:hypothetical protein
VLSRSQARWSETLSVYNFVIEHMEGSKNPADILSTRPDNEISYRRPVARLSVITLLESYYCPMTAIFAAQVSNHLPIDVLEKLLDLVLIDGTNPTKHDCQWNVVAEVLTHEGRIYVPTINSLHGKVISLSHENSESCHFGALMTTELESRDFYLSPMDSHVRKYVSGCEVYH